MQVQYCRDVQRCYFGKAPSIALIGSAYGRNTAEGWLEIQLENLSEFAGCKEKMNPAQISEMAAMIMEDYSHYKLTEFMLFFQKFKRCEYGKFYGAVDPMVIMQALRQFNDERNFMYDRKASEERRAAERAEDEERRKLVERYRARVPDAFTEKALIDFGQYRSMGYDRMTDEELEQELELVRTGKKKIPTWLEQFHAGLEEDRRKKMDNNQ